MNLHFVTPLLFFCVLSPIVYGTTWDEAQAAVAALEQKIQEITNSTIPRVKELAQNISEVRNDFLLEIILEENNLLDEYIKKIDHIELNLANQGYNVSICNDKNAIYTEGSIIIIDIKGCAYAKTDQASEILQTSITIMENALEEVENISSSLNRWCNTPACIDQAMERVANDNEVLPKQIEEALTQAEDAYKQMPGLFPNCSENKWEELKEKEDEVVVKIMKCIEDVIRGNTEASSTTVGGSTTEEASGSNFYSATKHLVLLPVLMVLFAKL